MALTEVTSADEGGERSDGWVTTREERTRRRLFLSDDWAGAEAEAPQLGDAHPTVTNLWVKRIQGIPWGAATDESPAAYAKCLVIVEYSSNVLSNDGEVVLEDDDATEVLEVGGGRTWVSDGAYCNQPINKLIPGSTIRLTRGYLHKPDAEIAECRGHVNDANWKPKGATITYPPGTALLLSASSRSQRDISLSSGYRYIVTYQFAINLEGHNLVPRVDEPGTPVFLDEVSPPIYESADFSQLQVH